MKSLITTRRAAIGAALCALGAIAIAAAPSQPERRNRAPAGLIAVVTPTEGSSVRGVVRFAETDGGVRVTARIEGLTPNSKHGFHVHEWGDASAADGTSAGGHFNPGGHDHDLPPGAPRHAGDLGNLEADGEGMADYQYLAENITLLRGANAILGRSVIIHIQEDDGSQPTGNAGARIGIGIIGVAQPE
ncbi:MAG: superoxide dismutase family protein [Phycisphaerales bacterium JB039]